MDIVAMVQAVLEGCTFLGISAVVIAIIACVIYTVISLGSKYITITFKKDK